MITLQDFLDKGYSIEAKDGKPAYRRQLLRWEDDYPKVLEVVRGVEEDNYNDRVEAVKKAFSGKYLLQTYCQCGEEIKYVIAYYEDDENAILLSLVKGKSKLSVFINKDTKIVYEVRDSTPYWGNAFSGNCSYKIEEPDTPIDKILESIKQDRKNDRRKIMNYFNKEIKETKHNYKSLLSRINGALKDI